MCLVHNTQPKDAVHRLNGGGLSTQAHPVIRSTNPNLCNQLTVEPSSSQQQHRCSSHNDALRPMWAAEDFLATVRALQLTPAKLAVFVVCSWLDAHMAACKAPVTITGHELTQSQVLNCMNRRCAKPAVLICQSHTLGCPGRCGSTPTASAWCLGGETVSTPPALQACGRKHSSC